MCRKEDQTAALNTIEKAKELFKTKEYILVDIYFSKKIVRSLDELKELMTYYNKEGLQITLAAN